MVTNRCPECGEAVTIWTDNSRGLTVNFRCDNPYCSSGKGPWDTDEPEHCPNEDEAWTQALADRARFKELRRHMP